MRAQPVERADLPAGLAAEASEHPERFRPEVPLGTVVLGLTGPGVGVIGKVQVGNPAAKLITIGAASFGHWDDVTAWAPVGDLGDPQLVAWPKPGDDVLVLDPACGRQGVLRVEEVPGRVFRGLGVTAGGDHVWECSRWALLPGGDPVTGRPVLADVAGGLSPSEVPGLLEAASERIEELAGAATHPWRSRPAETHEWPGCVIEVASDIQGTVAREVDVDDAAWIAALHPGVAEPLVAMLRQHAWETRRIVELHTDEPSRARITEAHFANPGVVGAVGLARLILPGWTPPESAPETPLSAPQSLQDGVPALPDTPEGVSGPLSAAAEGALDGLAAPKAGSGATEGSGGPQGRERDSGFSDWPVLPYCHAGRHGACDGCGCWCHRDLTGPLVDFEPLPEGGEGK